MSTHSKQQLTLLDSSPQNRLVQSLNDELEDLPSSWLSAFEHPNIQGSLKLLNHWLEQRKQAGAIIYPKHPFMALELIAPEDVKVVILGQDPYHGPDQAQGLAFSVPDTTRCPPSLRNIFKELEQEYPGFKASSHNLTPWAAQGVLLLNTTLTVEDAKAGSHAGKGWEPITDALIKHLFNFKTPKVFMLWGNHAQAKQKLIEQYKGDTPVLCLSSNHPSPLSALRPPVPFMGNKHFKLSNEWLESQGVTPIDWLV